MRLGHLLSRVFARNQAFTLIGVLVNNSDRSAVGEVGTADVGRLGTDPNGSVAQVVRAHA